MSERERAASAKGLPQATMHNSPDGTVITSPRGDSPIDHATEAARRVIDALLRTNRHNANLTRVAEELNSVADHLEDHSGTVQERLVDMWGGEGVTRHDPVTGPENAFAPPLVLRGHDDGAVRGDVTLTIPYQGPPTCVTAACPRCCWTTRWVSPTPGRARTE